MTTDTRPRDARLGQHTLVIPTYQRPALLQQLVDHLAVHARPLALLVLDSSEAEAADRNRKTVERHGEIARYHRVDSSTPMAVKLAQGLEMVDTPTVSLCADDDLVFAAAISEALDMLDTHPDHVSVHGLYFNFGQHGHDIQIMGEYAGHSIDADHPGARLFRLMQSYESLFYGVFRTEQLRRIFAGVAALPSLHFQELFQSAAALILGKVARLPVFYAARRSGPAAEPDRDKWQTYYWFADNPTEFVSHYLDYRDRLWAFYDAHAADAALAKADFERISDICHIMFFSKACPPAYFHSVLHAFWPNDKFDARDDDLLAELGKGHPETRPTRLEELLARAQAWVANRRRFAPSGDSAGGLNSLNAEVRTLGGTAWNCKIVSELGWLAGNDDFRRRYLDLCRYLNTAPAG